MRKICNAVILSTFYQTIPTFNNPTKEPFENIVTKGENAGDQHFLFFPTMFSTLSKTEIII